MSLVINNKVVKSKKGFTTLIKREGKTFNKRGEGGYELYEALKINKCH